MYKLVLVHSHPRWLWRPWPAKLLPPSCTFSILLALILFFALVLFLDALQLMRSDCTNARCFIIVLSTATTLQVYVHAIVVLGTCG
jgi:hypothetical protein